MNVVRDGQMATEEVSALLALNHDLRSEYIKDCQSGLKRWNRVLEQAGLDARLTLPHVGFNRRVGLFAEHRVTPAGEVVAEDAWEAKRDAWLPTDEDKAHVKSLMRPVYEPGKIAGWIAPPSKGINGKPLEYEYVHLP
jgi:benzoyl-CoA 2,3-dioxygenase component B